MRDADEFRSLATAELYEVYFGIDKEAHPERFARVEAEVLRREALEAASGRARHRFPLTRQDLSPSAFAFYALLVFAASVARLMLGKCRLGLAEVLTPGRLAVIVPIALLAGGFCAVMDALYQVERFGHRSGGRGARRPRGRADRGD